MTDDKAIQAAVNARETAMTIARDELTAALIEAERARNSAIETAIDIFERDRRAANNRFNLATGTALSLYEERIQAAYDVCDQAVEAAHQEVG